MQKFSLGVVAGMSSLALAVPLLAQVAGAATNETLDTTSPAIPSQECTQAMADLETAHLAIVDEQLATRKASMQAHRDALVAAAQIEDDAQRAEALKTAHEALRASAPEQNDAVTAAMEAVRAACGDTFHFMGGFGGPGFGGKRMEKHVFMKGNLSEKLGMTEEDFQAAIESGKTIEEIAEEQGVELPARPERGFGPKGGIRLFDRPLDDQTEAVED